MEITKERLAAKGWSKEEINKTMFILDKAEKKKKPHIKVLDRIVYWIALVLVIFGNFAFSTFLIPLLVTIKGFSLYIVILLLAAAFGVVMSVLVKDLENLQKTHHLLLLLIVPIVGLINFFVVVNMTNNNPLASALNTHHNPILTGVVYLIGFLIPYTYLVFKK
ncbi:hypothetical protein H8D36_06230 [archaeon]|nr:hypothetical protein [archaeon]MBL7056646.1 hypothetical protein [Candidatus Woesearchaeota archaeon]